VCMRRFPGAGAPYYAVCFPISASAHNLGAMRLLCATPHGAAAGAPLILYITLHCLCCPIATQRLARGAPERDLSVPVLFAAISRTLRNTPGERRATFVANAIVADCA